MKLKLYKDYLKEEIDNIKYDKKHPEKDRDNSNQIIILLLLIMCFFLPTRVDCFFYNNSNNFANLELNRFFPKTWKCKNCLYENYEGIGHCFLCGNKRFK